MPTQFLLPVTILVKVDKRDRYRLVNPALHTVGLRTMMLVIDVNRLVGERGTRLAHSHQLHYSADKNRNLALISSENR